MNSIKKATGHYISGQEKLNMLSYGIAGFIMSARTSAFSSIQEEFYLNYSSISLLVLVSGIIMQISTFLSGYSLRRYRHRLNIALSLFIFGTSFVLIYLSAGYWMVFSSFCIMLFGFGAVVLSLNMYTGFLAGKNPGPALMRLHLGYSLGALLGPKAISFFITSGMNWRFIYIPSACIVFIISFLYFYLPEKKNEVENGEAGTVKNIYPETKPVDVKMVKKAVLIFVVIFIAGQLWEYGFGTWFVIFSKQHFSLTEITSSTYLTLFWLCFPISRISAGYIVRKTGAVSLLAISFLSIFLCVATGFVFSIPLFFSITGLFTALLYPLTMTLMQQTLGSHRSDLIGIISMTGGFINYLLISSTGTIADIFGIAIGFGSISFYMLAGALASVSLGMLMSVKKSGT
ncbi:MAG: MFS transporter [Spirochaetia bacterium]|jgi:MFS family permease|nr:MFS transporter [Spirochaetia bacterium]